MIVTRNQLPFRRDPSLRGERVDSLPSKTRVAAKRSGVVLIAVLAVVVLLALAAYQYSELMNREYIAADSVVRQTQARSLAASGIHYAAALLANKDSVTGTLNNNPFDNESVFRGIEVGSAEAARFRGRFSLVAPPPADDRGSTAFKYGVVDEAGKLNLNALLSIDTSGTTARAVLMKLPNMTDEIADAILDWLDADDEPRDNGAENQHYTALTPGYRAKNGPLDTLEELLLIRGVTPELLFGTDRNRNGMRDNNEEADNSGQDRGWSAFLTVYTRESNVDIDGQPRTYLNDSDLNALYEKLIAAMDTEVADFILAYKLYGPYTESSTGSSSGGSGSGGSGGDSGGGSGGGGSGSGSGGSGGDSGGGGGGSGGGSGGGGGGGGSGGGGSGGSGGGSGSGGSGGSGGGSGGNSVTYADGPVPKNQLDMSKRPQSLSSIFSLINAKVGVSRTSTSTSQQAASGSPLGRIIVSLTTTTTTQTTVYTSPLADPAKQRQFLPILLDKFTTRRDAEIPARVNLLTAPLAVLNTLPNIQETDAQTIVDRRPAPGAGEAADPLYQTSAWLVTEAALSPTTVQALDRYVTGRTQVYRVQSLGYFEQGGPTARVEAVVDANAGKPRIVYWRDLSDLGRGFTVK